MIIFNVEGKRYESRQERIDSELKFCDEIFKKKIGVEATNRNVVEVRRIGRHNPQNEENEGSTNARPRPLLVKMTDTLLK